MKIKKKDGALTITTTVYQGKSGCLYMAWGDSGMRLEKKYADKLAYDVPEFDHADYLKYYEGVDL